MKNGKAAGIDKIVPELIKALDVSTLEIIVHILTRFDRGFFFNRKLWGGGMRPPSNHNFVIITQMIMKFGTAVKLDVLYTMVTKQFVMSLPLHLYDVNLYFS